MEGKYLLVALVIAGIIIGYIGYTLYAVTVPTPTPTPTPTPPTQMIGFEEAVESALKGAYRIAGKWKFSEYRWLGEFEGEPFVTPDGLVEGHLEWRASNGTLYEAEYPSGRVRGEVERFTGVEDTEEYYVWMITLMDSAVCHIDARNGEFLSFSPSRFPGVLTFEAAVRIVYAPQKRIEEWVVQEYKRIGDFEFEPRETPDGLVKGHLLWRASNGTLYEVMLPHPTHTFGKVLYIEVPDDTEEYNVWEITAEDKVYYIDARNGIIRLILGETTPVYLTPEEVRDAVMSYIRDHHPGPARFIREDIEWSGGDITPPGLVGKTTYQYLGGGWNVTISWPVVAKPTYEVRAEYKSPTGDLCIFWEGTVDQTGAVAEKIKGSYQSVESVRDAVMDYIRENHPDAATFIKDLVWSVTPPEPIPGWTMYQFIGDGWNVTIGYVVYYDITYEVTAENQQEGITWTGTVYDGVVTETSYEKGEALKTITGEYLPVGNPCTTTPCLPGIVYAVLTDGRHYYLTVEGHWIWENRPWDGYTPTEGDHVKVTGYVSKRLDVNGDPFYEIEVASLKPA